MKKSLKITITGAVLLFGSLALGLPGTIIEITRYFRDAAASGNTSSAQMAEEISNSLTSTSVIIALSFAFIGFCLLIGGVIAHFVGKQKTKSKVLAQNVGSSFTCILFLLIITLISGCGENLGEGYSRKGEFIYYKGKRIDKAGAKDIDKFAVIVRRKLTLCSNVDAASFEVLSQDYTKDKNKAYYKWISGPQFWVVSKKQQYSPIFNTI